MVRLHCELLCYELNYGTASEHPWRWGLYAFAMMFLCLRFPHLVTFANRSFEILRFAVYITIIVDIVLYCTGWAVIFSVVYSAFIIFIQQRTVSDGM